MDISDNLPEEVVEDPIEEALFAALSAEEEELEQSAKEEKKASDEDERKMEASEEKEEEAVEKVVVDEKTDVEDKPKEAEEKDGEAVEKKKEEGVEKKEAEGVEKKEEEGVEKEEEGVEKATKRKREKKPAAEKKEPAKKKPKKADAEEKKPRRKSDKPQFVKGVPISPMQTETSSVPNPYNYDPMAEVMQLGTGQLESAYRRTRTTVHLPKEKKIYKLEHKSDTESSHEVAAPPPTPVTPRIPVPPSPRESFIPDLSAFDTPKRSVDAHAQEHPPMMLPPAREEEDRGSVVRMAEKIMEGVHELNHLNKVV